MLFNVVVPGSSDANTSVSVPQAVENMLREEDAAPAENVDPTEPVAPEATSDVPADSEPAGDEELQEQSEDELEDESGEEAPQTFRVKVDGAEEEVTLDELLKGYSRTADYTRKTQAAAEQRKMLEAEAAQVKADRERYAAALAAYEENIKAQTPPEPDWAKLQVEDEAEFQRQWPIWQYHKAQMQKLAEEREATQRKLAEDRAKEYVSRQQQEFAAFLEETPEWKDEKRREAEQAELMQWATKQGFTEDEVRAVADRRNMRLLRKAFLYDKAKASVPKVQEAIEKVKVATPGPKTNRKPVSEVTRQKQRFAKTGRLDDVVRLIELEGSV
jgi:hypothetical protein